MENRFVTLDFDSFFNFIVTEANWVKKCLSDANVTFSEISVMSSYTGTLKTDFLKQIKLQFSSCDDLPSGLRDSIRRGLEKVISERYDLFLEKQEVGLQWMNISVQNSTPEPVITLDEINSFDIDTFSLPTIFSGRGCLSFSKGNMWDFVLIGCLATCVVNDLSYDKLKDAFLSLNSSAPQHNHEHSLSMNNLVEKIDAIDKILTSQPARITPERNLEFLSSVLPRVPQFQSYCVAELEDIIDSFRSILVLPGEVVIQQGEIGKYFYCVESGCLEVHVDKSNSKSIASPSSLSSPQQSSPSSLSFSASTLILLLQAGDFFGEMALSYDMPRAATVIARESSVLWRIDKATMLDQTLDTMLPDEEATGKWDFDEV